MHDILFYIFAAVILLSVMRIAFISNVKSSLKSFAYLLSGIFGLLIITNSQLFSLLICLLLLMIFFTAFLLKNKINEYLIIDTGATLKTNIFPALVISLLTAILASLFGNTRWQMINIDYSLNSFTMIFTKYLPFILAISLLFSVMIPVLFRIVRLSGVKS